MKPTLIIPSAKLVPEELQKLGKLPAVIYPVNQRIVFEYLYEQYHQICGEIRVICHEKADKVHRRLSAYEQSSVVILNLPQLGDLGDTVLYGLEQVKTPVVINFADTIVMDDMTSCGKDGFFYAEDYESDTWTFFEEEEGVITRIYDKCPSTGREKKKLFVGVFWVSDVEYFRSCLQNAMRSRTEDRNTFYHALCLYSKRHAMVGIQADSWFDIGHEETYYSSRLAVRARTFNHITIDKERGILRKSSEDRDKFIGEILWYLKLPSDIEYVRPRIFRYSTEYENPFIEMEYYAYLTVHELFLYGDLSLNQWEKVFRRIRFVCKDFRRYQVLDEIEKRKSLEDMYYVKTMQRLERLRETGTFETFFAHGFCINGVRYHSLESIVALLKVEIPKQLYEVNTFCIIHGDLCFSNIMVDENFSFIKVIDPRGKFGSYDIYGDFRYELAKLLHSVDGKYDFIIKDLYQVEYDLEQGHIAFSIRDRQREYDLCQIFLDVFREEIGDDLKKIEFIEALLFLSMIPLHSESLAQQVVMLGTGIELLARVLDIKRE